MIDLNSQTYIDGDHTEVCTFVENVNQVVIRTRGSGKLLSLLTVRHLCYTISSSVIAVICKLHFSVMPPCLVTSVF